MQGCGGVQGGTGVSYVAGGGLAASAATFVLPSATQNNQVILHCLGYPTLGLPNTRITQHKDYPTQGLPNTGTTQHRTTQHRDYPT